MIYNSIILVLVPCKLKKLEHLTDLVLISATIMRNIFMILHKKHTHCTVIVTNMFFLLQILGIGLEQELEEAAVMTHFDALMKN